MSMLLLQTFLLMLTAFFLGALVACLIKSTFFGVAVERTPESVPVPAPMPQPRPAAVAPQPPPRPTPDAVRPKIETVVRPTAAPSMPIPDAQRFERALKEKPDTIAQPAAALPPMTSATPAPAPAQPATPRVEVKQPEPLAATKSDLTPPTSKPDVGLAAAAAAAAAMAVTQARTPPASNVQQSAQQNAPGSTVSTAPSSGQAPGPSLQPIMPVASGSSGPAAVSAPLSPTPAPPVAAQAADDLTLIRAIDAAMQSRLNALGVSRFEDLARWTTADVARLRGTPGIGARIAIENWIEQAQILAKGGTTAYARRRAEQSQTIVLATPSPNAGVASPVRTPQASPAPPAAAAPPVPPPSAQAAGSSPAPGSPAPVASAPPSGFELPRSGAQAAAAAAAAIAAAAAASARRTETAAGTAASSAPSQASPARDDFQRIHGINAETEQVLYAQGITRYAQIAAWSATDTERLNAVLGSPGRIARENWIEQAAILAGGATATYARRVDAPARVSDADTSRPARLSDALREREAAAKTTAVAPSAVSSARPDLSNLRSVRSEALRGDLPGAGGAADDLKRIRGIGVLIEKKLNSLGISSYEQVANWTGADIDRLSQILDFKGRIERENWVEQARILASGGQTEFSRRVDKGDT